MINEEWIAIQIAQAKKSNPNVSDPVSVYIKELFHSHLTNEQLTSSELKKISIALLHEIGLDFPETGGKE
jgi:hypothetical protein